MRSRSGRREQRWVYHSRARRIAMAPVAVRQAAFGRYGLFGAEEFACGGLAIAYRHLSAERPDSASHAPDAAQSPGDAATGRCGARPSFPAHPGALHHRSELPRPVGGARRGARRSPSAGWRWTPAAGCPGRTVPGPRRLRARRAQGVRRTRDGSSASSPFRRRWEIAPLTFGAAAFLEVADRAGFCESLAGAWAKASPILRHAVETRIAGAQAATISRASGWVVERFVRWLARSSRTTCSRRGSRSPALHDGLAGRRAGARSPERRASSPSRASGDSIG